MAASTAGKKTQKPNAFTIKPLDPKFKEALRRSAIGKQNSANDLTGKVISRSDSGAFLTSKKKT